jgi:hypothetical protein
VSGASHLNLLPQFKQDPHKQQDKNFPLLEIRTGKVLHEVLASGRYIQNMPTIFRRLT